MKRVLTIDEYTKLALRLDVVGRGAHPSVIQHAVDLLKQSHRLLAEGRNPEDLTPTEQFYAKAFGGAICVQIPNDYGWEPGVEVEEKTEAEVKAPKPKREGK